MHFKDCDTVIAHQQGKNWKSVCEIEYDKADQDVFDRLAQRLGFARTQALEIDVYNIKLRNKALRVNPSTQVYELIAFLIGSPTGEKCPITGSWRLVGDASVTVQCKKGDEMPDHRQEAVKWLLQS